MGLRHARSGTRSPRQVPAACRRPLRFRWRLASVCRSRRVRSPCFSRRRLAGCSVTSGLVGGRRPGSIRPGLRFVRLRFRRPVDRLPECGLRPCGAPSEVCRLAGWRARLLRRFWPRVTPRGGGVSAVTQGAWRFAGCESSSIACRGSFGRGVRLRASGDVCGGVFSFLREVCLMWQFLRLFSYVFGLAAYPGANVHRVSRRRLGRGQHPQFAAVGAAIGSNSATVTITFSQAVIVSGTINLNVSGGLTLVSQTVNSPTVVTQVYSGCCVREHVVHYWECSGEHGPGRIGGGGQRDVRRGYGFRGVDRAHRRDPRHDQLQRVGHDDGGCFVDDFVGEQHSHVCRGDGHGSGGYWYRLPGGCWRDGLVRARAGPIATSARSR